MSLQTSLANFRAQVERTFEQVGRVALGKRPTAAVADITEKVGGKTLTQLLAAIRAATTTHINKTGNAHNDTPASVGIHSLESWQAIEPTLMPKSIVPVCRYGSLNYLPPGLTGSFEGGTTGKIQSSCAIMIEEDGTAVYLRNGTDGSKSGVFYAYVPNATIRPSQPVKTTRRYRPSWFPAGKSAKVIFACSSSVIFGQLQDANGVGGDYFMALTNGTYDDSKHTGGIIPQALAESFGKNGEASLAGNTVFFFGQTGVVQNGELDISVWSIPRSTLAAANGGNVTLTQTTGITTKGFGNVNYPALDKIRLTGKLASVDAGDNPMVRLVGTFFSAVVFYWDIPTLTTAYDPVSGKIRFRLVGQSRFVTTGNSLYQATGFSFTYDPAAKQATLDPYYLPGGNTVTNGGDLPVYAGPAFEILNTDKLATTGQQRSSYAFDDNGNACRIIISTGIDNLALQLGVMNNFVSRYANLEGNAQTISGRGGQLAIRPSFGTALGSNMFAPVMLSATKMLLQADGVNAAGAYQRGYVTTTLEGNGSAYTYESIYLGSVKGFSPSADRSFVSDQGLNPDDYRYTVNEVNANAVFVSTLRFSAGHVGLTTLNQTTGRVAIGPDLSLGAVVTCAESVLQTLASRISAQYVAQDLPPFTQFVVELIIPTTNGVPPFAIIVNQDAEANLNFSVSKVTVVRDGGGNIINATPIKTYTPRRAYSGIGRGLGYVVNNINYCGTVAMWDNGTDVLIGVSTAANFLIPGGNPIPTASFRYNRATDEFVHNPTYNLRTWNHFSNQSGSSYVVHPTLGFGQIRGTIGETGWSDETTKLNFLPIGRTTAEFDSWVNGVPAVSEWTCLASQKAAEGWVVYFSEETPLVLNGNYYTLPVSSIDLRSILADASNRTFYIYARIVSNVAQYVVQTGQTDESNTNMLVGTVTTNATQIVTINAEKVTRLGNARISITAKGSAIPVTTGLPRTSDKLQWS